MSSSDQAIIGQYTPVGQRPEYVAIRGQFGTTHTVVPVREHDRLMRQARAAVDLLQPVADANAQLRLRVQAAQAGNQALRQELLQLEAEAQSLHAQAEEAQEDAAEYRRIQEARAGLPRTQTILAMPVAALSMYRDLSAWRFQAYTWVYAFFGAFPWTQDMLGWLDDSTPTSTAWPDRERKTRYFYRLQLQPWFVAWQHLAGHRQTIDLPWESRATYDEWNRWLERANPLSNADPHDAAVSRRFFDFMLHVLDAASNPSLVPRRQALDSIDGAPIEDDIETNDDEDEEEDEATAGARRPRLA